MKKRILIALSAITLALSFSSFTTSPVPVQVTKVKAEIFTCHYGQCQATAKSTGNQCKHCVSNSGDKYCYQHK